MREGRREREGGGRKEREGEGRRERGREGEREGEKERERGGGKEREKERERGGKMEGERDSRCHTSCLITNYKVYWYVHIQYTCVDSFLVILHFVYKQIMNIITSVGVLGE